MCGERVVGYMYTFVEFGVTLRRGGRCHWSTLSSRDFIREILVLNVVEVGFFLQDGGWLFSQRQCSHGIASAMCVLRYVESCLPVLVMGGSPIRGLPLSI